MALKKSTMWVIAAAACAIGVGTFIGFGTRDRSNHAISESGETASRTLGDIWRLPDSSASTKADDSAIDASRVRDALRDVRVDAQGNLVLDHRVLEALRSGFASNERFDEAELSKLQTMIRSGLEAHAGEQAAQLVTNYLKYQVAAREMSENAVGGDLDSVETQLNRVIALRESYFGAETARALFGDEQAYTRFTIESMKIESDAQLTDEMKAKRQAELLATLPPRLQPQPARVEPKESDAASSDPSEWRARMAQFQREKAVILEANLAAEEAAMQLHQLLHEHFSAEEIDRVLRDDPTIEHSGP